MIAGLRLAIVRAAVVAIVAPFAAAGDGPESIPAPDISTLGATIGVMTEKPINPWIHPSMPECVKEKIRASFQIALERVREVAACGELFSRLGADGIEMLETSAYFPAGPFRETTRCHSSLAVTEVGAATIWVCRRISDYADERVAVALVHEALHHAGLSEYPHDRNGMDSGAINGMVMRSCGF
jgi:hypothetical protein